MCVLQAAQEPNARLSYIGFYNRCLWNVGACAALRWFKLSYIMYWLSKILTIFFVFSVLSVSA